VLLAVGVAWWASDRREGNRPADEPSKKIANHDSPPTPRAPTPRDPSPVPHHVEKPALAAATNSRPATPLEAAAFRVWQSHQQAAAWRQDAEVERAIAAVRYGDPFEEAQTVAAARPLLARRAYTERLLLESALYFDGSRRDAALRLLAIIGTTRTVRELLPLVKNSRSNRAVVATLLRLAPPENLALLARRERNPLARRAMLAALLTADDERSVGAYLTCVAHRTTRGDALQVAASTETLPTATLISWLASSDAQRSAAAATALAVARDPAAIEAVVALAQSQHAPASALVAIVGSEQPAAQSFVSAARHTPLVAAINEAQYNWRMLSAAAAPDL
jgi:hypothetical protein